MNRMRTITLVLLVSTLGAGYHATAGAQERAKSDDKPLPGEAPKALRATPAASGAVLQWQPVENSNGYRIYCEQDPGREVTTHSPWVGDAGYDQSRYEVTGLEPGTVYTFRISALYSSGEGRLSNQARVTPKGSARDVLSDTAP